MATILAAVIGVLSGILGGIIAGLFNTGIAKLNHRNALEQQQKSFELKQSEVLAEERMRQYTLAIDIVENVLNEFNNSVYEALDLAISELYRNEKSLAFISVETDYLWISLTIRYMTFIEESAENPEIMKEAYSYLRSGFEFLKFSLIKEMMKSHNLADVQDAITHKLAVHEFNEEYQQLPKFKAAYKRDVEFPPPKEMNWKISPKKEQYLLDLNPKKEKFKNFFRLK